ncbi:hypothetical protein Tco_1347123 [Tanacetum coccineum]
MSQPANDDYSQHLSDDEASYHEDASDSGTATNKPKQQQQQVTPTTTTISNIKLPILKKEEYDIWAMEMEHYLEYIDNDVWKVIQNGNSKKRISTGKDGVVRILPPVSAAEIHAVEKERKARTILLMAIPKEHLRRFHGMDLESDSEGNSKKRFTHMVKDDYTGRFHGMDDAKEIWAAIKTRFGGNANSKKMQKAVLKQQFEAFTISSKESLEKGYDRFQKLLSQLDALGAGVSDEDANHKFLRSLPPAWDSLAMTMRTKKNIDTLSIDDLYNNLSVFEQDIQKTSSSSITSDNVAFLSQAKSSKPKHKPTTAQEDIVVKVRSFKLVQDEKEAIDTIDEGQINWVEQTTDEELNHALMAFTVNNEVSMCSKLCLDSYNALQAKYDELQSEFGDQEAALVAHKLAVKKIGMKTVKDKDALQKIVDSWFASSKNLWKLIDCGMSSTVKLGKQMKDIIISHFTAVFQTGRIQGVPPPLRGDYTLCTEACIDSYNTLKTLCDEQMNQLGDQEAQILAYSQAVKKLEAQLVTFQKQQLSLNEKLTFQANEIYEKDEKLKKYRRIGMKAVKEKEQLQKTLDSWKDSSKNL